MGTPDITLSACLSVSFSTCKCAPIATVYFQNIFTTAERNLTPIKQVLPMLLSLKHLLSLWICLRNVFLSESYEFCI